jgi:signal transduction histidine kinase
LFWVFQVVLLTITVAHGEPARTGVDSLQASLIAWGVWGLLAPLIVWLDRALPISRDAIFKRFVIHIPFSLFFTALNMYGDMIGHALVNGTRLPTLIDLLHREGVVRGFQTRFYVFWMVLFIYIIFDYASHLKEREVRTAELERLVTEARLDALRARLHPHFLFNTLNTISAKVEREPRNARRMLEQLGQLLRISITHADDRRVPLSEEIDFIERYLDLQKMRFEENLTTIIDVSPDVTDALVPTFILQPMVENAVRYGMSSVGRSLVEVRAWQQGGELRLMVRDEGPGLPQNWDPERMAHIGIGNTRDRLREMYGDRNQAFTIYSDPGEGVRVEIRIPLEHYGSEPGEVRIGSPDAAHNTSETTEYGHHSRIGR